MFKISQKIINNNSLSELTKKTAVMLAVVYLGCFAVESILPGVMIEAFNFNFLLFLIVGLMANISFLENRSNEQLSKRAEKYLLVFLVFSFLITLFIVLYKVSLFETSVYLVFVFFLFKPLKKLFE